VVRYAATFLPRGRAVVRAGPTAQARPFTYLAINPDSRPGSRHASNRGARLQTEHALDLAQCRCNHAFYASLLRSDAACILQWNLPRSPPASGAVPPRSKGAALFRDTTEITTVLRGSKPITPLTPQAYAAYRQKGIGVLIWMAFWAAGLAALYFLSFWAGD
jgi:hypothetical protein